MDNELKELCDKYIGEFLNQEIVKQYFALEKQITEDEEIERLQEELKQSQKELALSIEDEKLHQEKLKHYLEVKSKIDNNPLINNYLLLKEEIFNQLKDLQEDLK